MDAQHVIMDAQFYNHYACTHFLYLHVTDSCRPQIVTAQSEALSEMHTGLAVSSHVGMLCSHDGILQIHADHRTYCV